MGLVLHKFLLTLGLCFIGFTTILHCQPNYKIIPSKSIHIELAGTSTLHNWVMNSYTFNGEAQFGIHPENRNQITSLNYLTFSLPVLDLKSDNKKLDKNAYKALKTDRYKTILYKLISATVLPEKENKFLIKTNGNLTIAGITKEITMDVYCIVNKDETITCTGTHKLKMTDYQVKPPTFMLGAMKTGDAITLDFTMIYKKTILSLN